MIIAPLPKNEEERLASVRELQLLDTELEESYEEIRELAAQICEAPISNISLMDKDRQWFKSVKGLAGREAPRDITFCSHTILQHEIMIVEDARKDKRFFDNPAVVGAPNIVFYAGVPLESPNHLALGTLCVIDSKPKHLTDFQRQALRVLGHQISNQFELRRQMNRLATAAVREATMAMVVTYNHEIINPLAVIKCLTDLFKDKFPDDKFKILHDSIDRIASTVQNIETTLRMSGFQFENYDSQVKMMKITK